MDRRRVILATLAVTETISYGILTYAFAVFIPPMEAELGWSRSAVTGAFSIALLVSGIAAVPVGRWVDRRGPRRLMAAGSTLAAVLLVAWSRVDHIVPFYAVWFGLGIAMACVLYEPAFAAVATWFPTGRTRALTTLTFVAGFASIVFVPLAAWLVEHQGWRDALVTLAAIVLIGTALPHALFLRRAPVATAAANPGISTRHALQSPEFRAIAVSFALATFASMAVFVHVLPFMVDRGYSATYAATVTGAIGLMALPGRLIFTPLGAVWPRGRVTALLFLAQAASLAVLAAWPTIAGLWTFVIVFGAGFGAVTPARAAIVAEVYGAANYGAISGVVALTLAVARALAPAGASALQAAGGYSLVFAVLAAVSLIAGAIILPLNRQALSSV